MKRLRTLIPMRMNPFFALPVLLGCTGMALLADEVVPPYQTKEIDGVEKNRLLPPKEGNPRNSEGDFIQLKDGRILFVFTKFTGSGGDHGAAHLAGRYSSDGGSTWTNEDALVIPREGTLNNMSVSLLRLQSGEIALFYLLKNSLTDCRPMMRLSRDEAKTWSDPVPCITDESGYYVLNNDRVIQLESGRLIMPVALHNKEDYPEPNWKGLVMSYFSDDGGNNWTRSETVLAPKKENGARLIAQEPGLVELKDGSLLMFIRSDAGSQLFSRSTDRGNTWSEPGASKLISPVSPASIERIPSTGDLVAVWNDHSDIAPELRGKRTPFAIALSKDDGKTWGQSRILEDDSNGWYCYTAIDFIDDQILLGHCAGDRRKGGLNLTQITKLPVSWLYP